MNFDLLFQVTYDSIGLATKMIMDQSLILFAPVLYFQIIFMYLGDPLTKFLLIVDQQW
jgi:hypothetical protein